MTQILPSNHRSNPSGTPVRHIGVPIEAHAARAEIRDMFRRWGITPGTEAHELAAKVNPEGMALLAGTEATA